MRVITIIPARGGSKSLPKKNILPLGGKPLLAHSIEYSLRSGLVDTTVVSTDSDEIAEIATRYGASVPFRRPQELSEDKSKDIEFMSHAMEYFEAYGDRYDVYVLLRPTSPLRPEGLIARGLEMLLKDEEASSVRSMALAKEHPYRMWSISSDGIASGFIDSVREPYNLPRQELPILFFQTGDIELVRRRTIALGSVSGGRVLPLIIDHEDMVDIDNSNDLDNAKARLWK